MRWVRKPDNSREKLTHWLSAVAMAAPAMPRRKVKMKRGSRKMLRIPPAVMPIMANWALPSARRMLFRRKDAAMMGAA
ncbi:MAG: hypothetical protein BWY88_00942 [Synergistetes bacterium ADurb.Bin520]|nr:MAG: hypothetical protein BWY88_00942 [Synergistetes bacterium ADurb.Bin520]